MRKRFLHELGDMLEYVTPYSTSFNVTITDISNNQIILADTKTVVDFFDTLYWDRVFIAKEENIEDAEKSFERVYKNYMKRNEKNFSLMYQALYDYKYNPIENYNRFEDTNVENGGKDTTTTNGSETGTTSSHKDITNTTTSENTNTTKSDTTNTETLTKENTNTVTATQSSTNNITYDNKETRSDDLHASATSNVSDTNKGQDTIIKKESGFNQPDTLHDSESQVTSYGKQTTTNSTTTTENTGSQMTAKTGTDKNITSTNTSSSDTINETATTTNKGNDTVNVTENGTNTGTITDTSTLATENTNSNTNETSYGSTVTTNSNIHGNIGVTTNQAMINAELEMRTQNLLENILERFINLYTVYM